MVWKNGVATPVVKNLQINLDPELAGMFTEWMFTEGFTNRAEAARALIRIALAATPSLGAEQATRLRAYNEVRNWAMARLGNALSEMKTLLEATK
jgi:hypothetical protein